MGNHDDFLLDENLIRQYTEAPIVVDSVDWCRALLSTAEIDFVRGFQRTLEVPLDGDGTLFLFHGSVRSNMEDLLATTPPDRVDEMLAGRHATVLSGGHTHVQMLRQHRGMLIVNPGSVGMPFKEFAAGAQPTLLPGAEYAIVESTRRGVSVILRRVPVEKKALRNQVADSTLPLAVNLRAAYA
jgi:diadenosine tetraphosphatase ApaH/serine/threonine PP2A family protein phosphatase